jgi:CobQ-like glutamine amidotransferase family enzyme
MRPVPTLEDRVQSGPAGDHREELRGHVVGTYPHGPALARNPALADLLPSWRVGDLASLDDSRNEALRQECLAVVLPG